MDSRLLGEVSISNLFDQFIEASTMRNVLSIHHRILNYADLNPCEFNHFFPKLKRAVLSNKERKNWKAKALFSKIDKKAAHRCYSNTKTSTLIVGNKSSDTQTSQEYLDDSISSSQPSANRTFHTNNALQHYNCLVIGSGPAGLRTAIELQLLGAGRVVIVEKRSRFSRNNVLHLWPFVIDDLKSLGAKKFYGKFCAGSIDHISIRQLQLILLKICLMIGCDFRDSCSYLYLCPETLRQTKPITIEPDSENKKSSNLNGDIKNESLSQRCDLAEQIESSNTFIKCNVDATTDESSEVFEDQSNNEASPKVVDNDVVIDRDQQQKPDSSSTQPKIIGNHTRVENLHGARAHFQSEYNLQEKELHSHQWDFIIGADGRRNTLSKFFPRKEFRGRLAIAITANFINRQTPTEAAIPEISGLSFIYNQDMFNALAYDTNIQLENICYYKDDTHYFVMTAKKKSLLERGVLLQDYATTQDLLSDNNVNKEALLKYAKDAAFWTTGLEPLNFALNHYGQEDCAMFDFTSMYAASNACKALRTKDGGLTLVNLVGDSLLEPFWPTGSGCARGFLSSFDAAWMCRQWAVNRCAVIDYHGSMSSRSSRNRNSIVSENSCKTIGDKSTYNRMALSVMAERESIYRILAQTKSENLQQNYSHWTLNPHTRYPNLNRYLVTPSQCEHLITDFDSKVDLSKLPTPNGQRTWRVKSPNNGSHRKSPKKLKSASASPQMQAKNRQHRAKSLSKSYNPNLHRGNGMRESSMDDTYLEFERSYNDLADGGTKQHNQYLSYGQQSNGFNAQDELFIPSISGTMPSSNNLLSLEARRARDIDDCLRQRRQKTQIGAVKDHLMLQMRKSSFDQEGESSDKKPIIRGNVALFSELRRLREQQATGKENMNRDIAGPLTLLNSMRRCASFAERVKSFESKLSSPSCQESTVTTPRTPTDNVKNLPEFATLQELFVKNIRGDSQDREGPKKAKMPIMKLSKDDWNVKCWEKRLAAYKQRIGDKELSSSTRSLNKSTSVDGYRTVQFNKPEKQVEVFRDRVKDMAEKLEKVKEPSKRVSNATNAFINRHQKSVDTIQTNNRPRSWVNHLKQELTKGNKNSDHRPTNAPKPAMNPSLPSKPIKKLFADDDEDDDGIDVNKHYDHLCVNKPSNRVFSKNNYTSHLRRTKFDNSNSKVVNVKPTSEGRQAYLAAITPRTSSASSTLSDYSTNTGGSSSGCGSNEVVSFCARCKTNVRSMDRIRISKAILHKTCLTCSECGITLRTNEIQYYLDAPTVDNGGRESESSFACAICKPEIRNCISSKTATELEKADTFSATDKREDIVQQRMKSRADFLSERINYNEVYKNIFGGENKDDAANGTVTVERRAPLLRTTTHFGSTENDTRRSLGDDDATNSDNDDKASEKIANQCHQEDDECSMESQNVKGRPSFSGSYRIERSETIDGSEQVTIVLDPEQDPNDTVDATYECREPGQQEMVDEDELNKMLHLEDTRANGGEISSSDGKVGESPSTDDTSGESDVDGNQDNNNRNAELSDDPSSLNSPPDTDEYDDDDGDDDDDDDDDNGVTNEDRNSTYDDFLTSEEFGTSSDREDEDNSNHHQTVESSSSSSRHQKSQKSLPVSSG